MNSFINRSHSPLPQLANDFERTYKTAFRQPVGAIEIIAIAGAMFDRVIVGVGIPGIGSAGRRIGERRAVQPRPRSESSDESV